MDIYKGIGWRIKQEEVGAQEEESGPGKEAEEAVSPPVGPLAEAAELEEEAGAAVTLAQEDPGQK